MTTRSVVDRFDGKHPAKTALRLYSGQRGRLTVAAIAFAFKHSPVWVMPLLTANVIDAVVQKKPLSTLWINAGVMTVLVLQNVPLSLVYVRRLSFAVRTVETELRVALCERLQQLSIGYHRRTSAGVLQAKVIRDVENVVETSRQVFDSGMAALTTLVGAVVLIALRVPEFLPVFLVVVPASALRRSISSSSRSRARAVSTSLPAMTDPALATIRSATWPICRTVERITGLGCWGIRDSARLCEV